MPIRLFQCHTRTFSMLCMSNFIIKTEKTWFYPCVSWGKFPTKSDANCPLASSVCYSPQSLLGDTFTFVSVGEICLRDVFYHTVIGSYIVAGWTVIKTSAKGGLFRPSCNVREQKTAFIFRSFAVKRYDQGSAPMLHWRPSSQPPPTLYSRARHILPSSAISH